MKIPTKIDASGAPGEPISGQGSSGEPPKVLDILHLEHQVLGDTQLRDELLQLFASQLMELAPRVCGAPGQARSEAAHRLKGAALAVGAFALARVCGELEGEGADEAGHEVALVIESTRRRVGELLRPHD
jgi:HPt (histidine-containing phosphotransfer) domain-containing protein